MDLTRILPPPIFRSLFRPRFRTLGQHSTIAQLCFSEIIHSTKASAEARVTAFQYRGRFCLERARLQPCLGLGLRPVKVHENVPPSTTTRPYGGSRGLQAPERRLQGSNGFSRGPFPLSLNRIFDPALPKLLLFMIPNPNAIAHPAAPNHPRSVTNHSSSTTNFTPIPPQIRRISPRPNAKSLLAARCPAGLHSLTPDP